MSGVTLSDLSKYHQGAMKWFKDGLVSEHNRLFAQTGEAGAVSFWPLGGTPLEGKVKFSFKETPPASGDKGPENPSTISGVSSINVGLAGKNLLLYRTNTQSNNGVTGQYDSSGRFVLDGTKTNNGQNYFANTDGSSLFGAASYMPSTMRLNPQKAYTLSGRIVSGSFNRAVADGNAVVFVLGNKASAYSTNIGLYSDRTFQSVTVPAGRLTDFIIRTNLNVGSVYGNLAIELQLEEGSAATGFESPMAPADANHAITLGSTYYGGEIDLATGVMTVTHSYVTFTGGSGGDKVDANGYCAIRAWLGNYKDERGSDFKPEQVDAVCAELPNSTSSATGERFYLGSRNNANETCPLWVILHKDRLGYSGNMEELTAAETRNLVNAYLSQHPLHMVLKREEPYTVQLDPLHLTALTQKDKYTPRVNTVYTDADSIQISYRKSLIHDEDEKVQAIVALGGNV